MSQSRPSAPQPQSSPVSTKQKPEPQRAKELAALIASSFPDVKVEYMRERRLKVSSEPSRIKEVALFVRNELGFDHISAVSGVDWIAKNEFEIVYFIGSVSRPGYEDFVIAISERVARDNPVAPTLIDVWIGVDYQERETHEMFGINFQGHPSNAHLILPEDWNDMPPLRKDYVSPGR
jgi:NADH-quinone oxidoreductase subunit C